MSKYLVEANYTLDGIKGVREHGGSARIAAAEELIKSVGGNLESFYFFDSPTIAYIIADFPDDESAAGGLLGRRRRRRSDGANCEAPHGRPGRRGRCQKVDLPTAGNLGRSRDAASPGGFKPRTDCLGAIDGRTV